MAKIFGTEVMQDPICNDLAMIFKHFTAAALRQIVCFLFLSKFCSHKIHSYIFFNIAAFKENSLRLMKNF